MNLGIMAVIVGFFLALCGFWVFLVIKTYTVPKGDEALVRTGGSEARVSTSGGLICLPVLHQLSRISTQAVVIGVSQRCRTSDHHQVALAFEMTVRVENPLLAVQSLGSGGAEWVQSAVSQRVGALMLEGLRCLAIRKSSDDLPIYVEDMSADFKDWLEPEVSKLGLRYLSGAFAEVRFEPEHDSRPRLQEVSQPGQS